MYDECHYFFFDQVVPMPYEPQLTHHHLTTCLVACFAAAMAIFDFAIFWYQADVLARVFFENRHLTSWLSTWYHLTMSGLVLIGMPIGGLIFGMMGDRLGRKPALLLCLLIAALSTACIAMLPNPDQIGAVTPISIGILRFVQVLACGTVLPIALVMALEHLPTKRLGIVSGGILASCIAALMTLGILYSIISDAMSLYQLLNFGWRLLFVIGACGSLLAAWLVFRMNESPVYLRKAQDTTSMVTDDAVLRQIAHADQADTQSHIEGYHPAPNHLAAIALSLILAALILFIPIVLLPLEDITFIASATQARFGGYVGLLFMMIGCLFYGLMADLNNAGRVLRFAGIFLLVFSAGFIYHLQLGGGLVLVFYALIGFTAGLIGAIPAVVIRLFPTKHRLLGVALTFTAAYALLSAFVPMILNQFSNTAYSSLLYVMLIGLLVVFISFYVYYIPRTAADLNR